MTDVSFPSASEGDAPSAHFRNVLGSLPTGVVLVSATGGDGDPVGMIVGSFTSVSLDPPMVAFLADRRSTTFPRIRDSGRFGASVLASDQADDCRLLASKRPDRFDAVAWSPSDSGAPLLDGAVAWIDCRLAEVVDAGDHVMALADVVDLRVVSGKLPLVFFRGEYGAFRPGAPFLADWFAGWG